MAIIESGSIPSLPRSPQLQKTMPREDFPAPDRTKPHQNNGGIPCDSCQMDPNALGLLLFSLLLILSEGHTHFRGASIEIRSISSKPLQHWKTQACQCRKPTGQGSNSSSCFTVPGLWGNK